MHRANSACTGRSHSARRAERAAGGVPRPTVCRYTAPRSLGGKAGMRARLASVMVLLALAAVSVPALAEDAAQAQVAVYQAINRLRASVCGSPLLDRLQV